MEYVPTDFITSAARVGAVADLLTALELTLVRQVRVLARGPHVNDQILLKIEGLTERLPVRASLEMRFGDESVTAAEYLDRVIEEFDLIDLLVDASGVRIFWIHIRYLDQKPGGLSFSRKDDGLFAMRTKAGEKAQRLVARELCQHFGHRFPPAQILSPGCFEISYEGKTERKADLTCEGCGLKVEVKKRNRDRRFRISHSSRRPFAAENRASDWHAFVFADRSIHWLPNATILNVLVNGRVKPSSDQYDAWADLPDTTTETPPPQCPAPILTVAREP